MTTYHHAFPITRDQLRGLLRDRVVYLGVAYHDAYTFDLHITLLTGDVASADRFTPSEVAALHTAAYLLIPRHGLPSS